MSCKYKGALSALLRTLKYINFQKITALLRQLPFYFTLLNAFLFFKNVIKIVSCHNKIQTLFTWQLAITNKYHNMFHSGNTSSIKAELDGKICSKTLYIWKGWRLLDKPPRTVKFKINNNPQYKKEKNIFTRQT